VVVLEAPPSFDEGDDDDTAEGLRRRMLRLAELGLLHALPDIEEDAERRARGVTVEHWLEAPPPPATRGDCELDGDNGSRPCPALRCKYHLGRVGEAAGFTCWLDVCDLPEDEAAALSEPGARQTFVTIGRVLQVTWQRAQKDRDNAVTRMRELDPESLRLLAVRRR
jgi:hypothetical protein